MEVRRRMREKIMKIQRLWEQGKGARVEFVFKGNRFDFNVEEAADVDLPKFYTKSYVEYWNDCTRSMYRFKAVLILPPPTNAYAEDPDGALRMLPRIFKHNPFDLTLPSRVMAFFEKLYGTYSTPAHTLRMTTKSRGGDYPDDYFELEIVYDEYSVS